MTRSILYNRNFKNIKLWAFVSAPMTYVDRYDLGSRNTFKVLPEVVNTILS
jgi:hypothetical protein